MFYNMFLIFFGRRGVEAKGKGVWKDLQSSPNHAATSPSTHGENRHDFHGCFP